ncbi:MAG: glycosyltransferase family 2 protein [Deltaproteobacteria bacterium]|nr:glycosyltransferase family 2 protein [Deltaproteobacteria bacterium]
MSRVRVSVVVPVYKNRATLDELCRRLRTALDGAALTPFEILLIDDACPEGSSLVARALAAHDPRVRAVSLKSNAGQQRAVMVGLRLARGDWVVTLDADLQDPPEAVPGLIAAATPETSAVFGGRRGRYEPALRLLTSRLFKRTLRLLTGVPADAGMFVAMRRPLVLRLLQMPVRRPFVVAMIGASGLDVLSVPVRRDSRPHGVSAYSARARLALGLDAVRCALECRWAPRRSPAPPPDYLALVADPGLEGDGAS